MPVLLKLLYKVETGMWANSFLKGYNYLYPINTDPTKKVNYNPVFLINTDVKILNNIFVNQIQEHIKKMIHHDQVCFISEMHRLFNIHKSMNYHMIV